MEKGLGIAALALAIVAIFVPFLGIFAGWIALALAAFAVRYGERPMSIAAVAISAANFIFLTPSMWMGVQAGADRGQLSPILVISIVMLIVPIAALVMGTKAGIQPVQARSTDQPPTSG
jgi:hypothetical protein